MNLNADEEVTNVADLSTAVQFGRFEQKLAECLKQISELQVANRVLLEQLNQTKTEAFAAIEAKNVFLTGMMSDIQRHSAEGSETGKTTNNKPLSGVKVLIAEDSPDNQMLMRQYLSIAGAEVDIADNGQEAIEMAMNGNHQVVIMDVMMPVCDGYEATRTLREKGFKKPIIALTAHALKEQREQSLKEGCNEHLVKPINRPLLISTIAKFAEQSTSV